ncbi:MAG: CoA transferase, partial [Chloroflexi bacterium]|nr:CoA transferase [Chloroflexota bacterium]
DLSLFHVGVWGLGFDIEAALHFGREMSRTDRRLVPNPIWNVYRTKDARWVQFVMAQTDMYWPAFCKAIARPEWVPQYDSHEKRIQASRVLIPLIEEVMVTKTYAEWDAILKNHGVIYGVVQSPLDVIRDPQASANHFFKEIEHPVTGKFTCIQSPIKFSKTPASVRTAAPSLGQHTEEVLLESGYTWDDIGAFKSQGAIL